MMISMWALVGEDDLQEYAGTLVLPPYLSHLRLGPFRFAAQSENCDGEESLKLTYLAEGRLEEFLLHPKKHVLPLIQFVCPKIDASRIRLPRDDASWHWSRSADPPEKMRIYFAPTTCRLYGSAALPPSEEAYVSVSRSHVFIGRSIVKLYLEAWLDSLGIDDAVAEFDFGTPSSGVEFTAGAIGGQMFLSDEVMAEDLMRFAGLDQALSYVSSLVKLDLDSAPQDHCGVFEDGIYISLSRHSEDSEDLNRGQCSPERP
jgi:hypothetical protein